MQVIDPAWEISLHIDPQFVRPNPSVKVGGWNQIEKVGGGGTVAGGLPARNGKGTGANYAT